MAIQDEMFKAIEQEIETAFANGKVNPRIDKDKTLEVAKMLTSLSTDNGDAKELTSQYIVNIKNICNS